MSGTQNISVMNHGPGRSFRWALAFWTAIVVVSCVYSYSSIRDAAFHGARLWAQASFEKDIVMRHWSAEHGGVYVPVSPKTQPNPYLKNILEREITTPSGRVLTLVNPAYMTRQMYELAAERNNTRGHITSLNPIRPGNEADAWERDALESFQRGEKERVSLVTENGQRYLRFMRPFVTEAACLKCHAAQGYKVGDVRGGISISVELAPYIAIASEQTFSMVFAHAFVWVFGVIMLYSYARAREERRTERRLAEERIRMSERQLSLIYNSMSDLVMLVRVERGEFSVLSANRALYDGFAGFGVALAEDMIVGNSLDVFWRVLQQDDTFVAEMSERCAKVVADGTPMTCEQSFVLPYGTLLGLTTLIPVLDDAGKCTHILWSCRNMTVRNRMLQSLRETEESYSRLFNAMIDGFALVELVRDDAGPAMDYIYRDVNPAMERIFGMSRPHIVGNSFRKLFPGESDEWMAAVVGEDVEGVVSEEGYSQHLDKYLKLQIYTPKPGYRAVLFSDISERVLAEREKEALQEQLLQAQKMEAIGQLAGGIAHDFNNILTSIISNAYVLKKRLSEDEDAYLFVEEIFTEAGRAANLTKGLLAFSRKQSIHLVPVSVNEIVKKMGGMLQRIIGEDIAIRLLLSEEDIIALADSGQIEQVVMNCATNARDAMPHGGELTIESDHVDVDHAFVREHGFGEARRYAVIRIRDTGSGMDEKTKARIFEPFFTTKAVGKGTGLGLAIAYGIVRQHRGYMEVESKPGAGTTFLIYLPVGGQIQARREIPESVISVKAKGTILIAEDEDPVRRGMRTVLESAGYSVIEAGNGEEALAQYRAHQAAISLVILDVIMPRMNGREVFDAIRALNPGVKVVFLSGYASSMLDLKGLDMTALKVLEKPCVPMALLSCIREMLGESASDH